MSRRRRQRNPLLIRIVLISLAAHVVALPILAHFGAFDKMKKSFGTAMVVMLEPPKQVVKPPEIAKKLKKAQTQNVNKGQNKGRAAARPDLPRVAVQEGPGAGAAPTVVQGTQNGGGLPPGAGSGPPKANTDTEHKTTDSVKPVIQPPPPPPPPPPPVGSGPTKTVAKHLPIYTEVEPTYQPEPTIPDDLRDQPLDKTAVIEVTVDADGSIESASLAKGTGIRELDDIALRTAKSWRFKPATADGEAVVGKLRLRIEFKVE